MRNIIYILLALTITLGSAGTAHGKQNNIDKAEIKEYQVKVAFIYNFFNFVEWPKETSSNPEDPISIGLIGKDIPNEITEIFETLTQKKFKDKKIMIKKYTDINPIVHPDESTQARRDELIESMKQCHALMFYKHHDLNLEAISTVLKAMNSVPILTIGEHPGFIETGGHIGFLTIDNKIRFEINHATIKEKKLSIRAKLLKLAKRVIHNKK